MTQTEIIFLLIGLLLGLAFYCHRKIVFLTFQVNDLNQNQNNLINFVSELSIKHNFLAIDSTKSNTAIINAHNDLVNQYNNLVSMIVGGGSNNNQKRESSENWDNRLGDYFSDN